MEQLDLGTSFTWKRIGPILLDEQQKIRFPETGARPGLYRFEFGSGRRLTQYIGESDRLSRRLQHYRTPGRSQQTNIRLNRLILDHLNGGGQVFLSTVTGEARIILGDRECEADLSAKYVRLLLESAALTIAEASVAKTLNLNTRIEK